jgi:hypothetical protein
MLLLQPHWKLLSELPTRIMCSCFVLLTCLLCLAKSIANVLTTSQTTSIVIVKYCSVKKVYVMEENLYLEIQGKIEESFLISLLTTVMYYTDPVFSAPRLVQRISQLLVSCVILLSTKFMITLNQSN